MTSIEANPRRYMASRPASPSAVTAFNPDGDERSHRRKPDEGDAGVLTAQACRVLATARVSASRSHRGRKLDASHRCRFVAGWWRAPECRPRPSARRSLSVEVEPRCVLEDGVGGEERSANMDRRRRDPEVVGMDRFMQRMSGLSAGVAKLGDGRQQGVTDGHDRGRGDRLLQPLAALISPTGDERAVAELGNGAGGEEDLVAGHETDLGLDAGAAASADGRAEDAGVDEDPHDSSAAANASSSASERSSISRESIESSTWAASS